MTNAPSGRTRISASDPITHVVLDGPVECVAQVRAHGGTAPAVEELVDGVLQVSLREPSTQRYQPFTSSASVSFMNASPLSHSKQVGPPSL